MNIGIVSYGLYTPKTFETAADVAGRAGIGIDAVHSLGIRRKCRPGPEDQPVVMAAAAARQALDRAGDLTPDRVDVVIWTGEEYKDYVAQTPSIRLQEEIGCRRAWAFDLVGQGVTLVQGMRVAADLMAGDDRVRTVLLAGGTRNVDLVDAANRNTRFLLAASASGGAMILQAGHPENRLVDTAFSVDAHMADAVYVPGGGTETPFSPDNLNTPPMYYHTPDPAAVESYLATRWTAGLCKVARQVLAGSAPDYLALRHLAPSERMAVLDDLAVASERSAVLDDWGAHGTNDPILSLDLGLRSGAVTAGSRVAAVTGGIGFTFAAALIRWGRADS